MLDQTNFAASPSWTVANLTFDAVVTYDRSHSRIDFAAGSVMFTAGGISDEAALILAQVCALEVLSPLSPHLQRLQS